MLLSAVSPFPPKMTLSHLTMVRAHPQIWVVTILLTGPERQEDIKCRVYLLVYLLRHRSVVE